MRKLNKLIRNEKGSITMFVTLSVLFLIFVLVGIYTNHANKLKAQEEQIGKIQNNYGEYASEEEMDKLYLDETQPEDDGEAGDTTVLPTGEGTTPWLPSGFSQVTGTSLATGLTIANTNDGTAGTQNYVWIEVPNNIKQIITVNNTEKSISLAEATTNEEIELILKAYAGNYTKGASTQNNNWKDVWYDGSGNTSETSTNLNDTTGCGMTYQQYQTSYNQMLNSIKKYGGFWLAQYEAGISYSQANRTTHSEIEITKANYAKNQYPYNFVYCRDGQQIASADSTDKYTSSLPFGIQWDLVCRFLETKNAKTYSEIATNSTWGNYTNMSWVSSVDSKYSSNTTSFTSGEFQKSSGGYLLTTGAIDKVTANSTEYIANPMNIYDFAGNVWEWTLEYTTTSGSPCASRGGGYKNNSSGNWGPAPYRATNSKTNGTGEHGFRSVLY